MHTIISLLYFITRRTANIFTRIKQRFLSVFRVLWVAQGHYLSSSRGKDYCNGDQDTVNARRQTENGIYARNRKRRARVIRRIDRLVFVPGRNLPLFVCLAFFFFLVFKRTRTTIDTWRGRRWRGRRERELRSTTEARKREGGKTEEGW